MEIEMGLPFDFDENEIPEPVATGGGKLEPGIYNLVFNRIASADDNADELGQVSGKNGWKALKMFFDLKGTVNNDQFKKPATLDVTFVSDYDPTRLDKNGQPMRVWMIDNAKKSYKAMMFYAGAQDLTNPKTSLVGRELSCQCIQDDDGYLRIDPGAVGENWSEVVEHDMLSNSKPTNEPKIEKSDAPNEEFGDTEIPF